MVRLTTPLLLLVLIAFPAASRAAADKPADKPARGNHVVIVTLDGFPAYLMSDPAAPIPTLRKLAAEGVMAEQGMRVVNPSVTWPNHTTLITGVRPARHSVLFNGVLVRPGPNRPVKVDGHKDQSELIAPGVATIFDVVHKAGLRTAAIDWPCTRNSSTLDDNWPDVPEQVKYTTPRLLEELVAAGVLKDATHEGWAKMNSTAAYDQVWTAAACNVVRQRKPNLLLLHLLVIDSIHHRYGPQTPAGYAAVALADNHVRDLLATIDAAGIRERTTVFIVADHGFEVAKKLIQPNVALRKAGLLRVGPTAGIFMAKVQAVSEGGTALVYFTDPETKAQDREKALPVLRGLEGIAEVIEPGQFAEYGLPHPDKNPQMGDLVLVGKEGYAFTGVGSGDEEVIEPRMGQHTVGHHGYLHTNPKMNAVFIAAGRGIRKGAKLEVLDNVDLAPTAARLLGHEMADVDGKVLDAILAGVPRGQLAAAANRPATQPVAGKWRTLFNGRDLEGWTPVGNAVWRVEEGVLVGTQDGDPKRGGLLTTKDQFQDFELELDFMIDEHGKYNSGVYLRNDPGRGGRSGYQVNIGRGEAQEYCAGLFLSEWLDKGDEKDTIRKKLDWNSLRIVARGAHIVVDLNGVNVVDFTDPKPQPRLLQRGVLGFQTYGAEGHAGWVKFRNVRIREL